VEVVVPKHVSFCFYLSWNKYAEGMMVHLLPASFCKDCKILSDFFLHDIKKDFYLIGAFKLLISLRATVVIRVDNSISIAVCLTDCTSWDVGGVFNCSVHIIGRFRNSNIGRIRPVKMGYFLTK